MRAVSVRGLLARAGFEEPQRAAELIGDSVDPDALISTIDVFAKVADPDAALAAVARLLRDHREALRAYADDDAAQRAIARMVGASGGLAALLERLPELLPVAASPAELPSAAQLRDSLLESVAAVDGVATLDRVAGIVALRRRYRHHLVQIAAYDLASAAPVTAVPEVARALSDLASAALEASLALARHTIEARFSAKDIAGTRFAIIGMGKLGARELNYVSDVDVIWVHAAEGISEDRAVAIATALARETAAGCTDVSREPALWEVDANLRPEGKDGALTRTLPSHLAYYERWAKSWEFQALLKARPVAGDAELGAAYEAQIRALVWESSSRDGFVESVQRMRERVTEHIPADEVDRQLKLGPGGLRDIEFTIQLLQLVHGANDAGVRERSTLDALDSLADSGYIGRTQRAEFAEHYRFLRLLEHRVQLWRLTRTHLMPTDPLALRRLARASGYADATALVTHWGEVKRAVRTLHEQLFYRPLLSAVAALPDGGTQLTSEQAVARLQATGFADPGGALEHIASLTGGVSRRAQVQRVLLPVLLHWLAEGPNPDAGLVAFRRLSEALGESPWFLRMLRDSSVAAEHLMFVLSTSRRIAALFERIPEAAQWLASESRMRALTHEVLRDEAAALVRRHRGSPKKAANALRALRRRELLRACLASALGIEDVTQTGRALRTIAQVVIDAAIELHAPERDFEFAVIAMGRTGGGEIGFGSDIDVMYVARGDENAVTKATALARALQETVTDPVVKFELDAALRPEGKQGPMVRSLESYLAYYRRWSHAWEAQALLRASAFAGDASLAEDFLADIASLRYPNEFGESNVREIRRMKARVEAERLPKGADRRRHLKLGTGTLSDVEWLVQLLQLRYAAEIPGAQSPSTLEALASLARADVLSDRDADVLRSAWLLSSRLRNALSLAQARSIDTLPRERDQLEVLARLLGMRAGSASALEDLFLQRSRRARKVFEQRFYA